MLSPCPPLIVPCQAVPCPAVRHCSRWSSKRPLHDEVLHPRRQAALLAGGADGQLLKVGGAT